MRPGQQPVAYSQWLLLGPGCGPYHVSSHVPEKHFPTGPRSQGGNRVWRKLLTRSFPNTPTAQGPAHDCRMCCFQFISCLPLQEMITPLVLTMPVCTKTMWILLSLPYPGLSTSPSLPTTLHLSSMMPPMDTAFYDSSKGCSMLPEEPQIQVLPRVHTMSHDSSSVKFTVLNFLSFIDKQELCIFKVYIMMFCIHCLMITTI